MILLFSESLFNPLVECDISTNFLLMLRFGKCQVIARGVSMLVWEDNHQIGAREEAGNLFWQSLQSRLVGYGSLSGCYHYEEMVLAHV